MIASSPRLDGNSAILAEACAEGARTAGHEVEVVRLSEHLDALLGDCGTCRDESGRCTLADGYEVLLLERFVPADAVVFATPLHYYGMTSRLKAFFDRLYCHTSDRAPHAAEINGSLAGKRVAVLISCEESYQGANLGLVAQFQEIARYHHQPLVGVVIGIANSRGEIVRDPADPVDQARRLGSRLFEIDATDYRFDTDRSHRVWG